MEAKRLIPYSVHLPEDVYLKLKEAAGNRKASALVRDAITLIVEGDDEFNGGYNKGVRDCIRLIQQNELCKAISYYDDTLAKILSEQIEELVVNQNVKGRGNGNKKKT
jgi:hypothetical protein